MEETNETTTQGKTARKPKMNWSAERTSFFVEAVRFQILAGKRAGSSIHEKAWDVVLQQCQAKFHSELDVTQWTAATVMKGKSGWGWEGTPQFKPIVEDDVLAEFVATLTKAQQSIYNDIALKGLPNFVGWRYSISSHQSHKPSKRKCICCTSDEIGSVQVQGNVDEAAPQSSVSMKRIRALEDEDSASDDDDPEGNFLREADALDASVAFATSPAFAETLLGFQQESLPVKFMLRLLRK
ncbi:hypothetical protein DFJ73DRAFT_763194 [Zopfochytrium polystomum]|nr:hypothetical protein DFJ73DRAFT_763194 [Zopfochytrium polystomum]